MTEVLEIAKKDGRWTECPSCSETIITQKLKENLWVCPHCDYHFRLGARDRIDIVCDGKSFMEIEEMIAGPEERSQVMNEAIKTGETSINGMKCVMGIMDFSYKGGSMGVAVGEAVIRLMNHGRSRGLPLVMFCASGGVRVQEGIWGLLQMLRTVHARTNTLDVPMITVFTDPTTGGVSASFASLADVILAEPGARIGFAGPRVIESTLQCTLPPDFQQSNKLLANGFIDMIVHRNQMRETLAFFLKWFSKA